jgi:hypothetical protein
MRKQASFRLPTKKARKKEAQQWAIFLFDLYEKQKQSSNLKSSK